ILAEGHPQIGPAQELKTGGQDADNCVALVVESNCAANNRGIAPKLALPKAMAQHHYRRAAGSVLFGDEGAARDDAGSQHWEKVRTRIANQHALRLAIACKVEAF